MRLYSLRAAATVGVLGALAAVSCGCGSKKANATPGMKVAPQTSAEQAAVARWRQARTAKRQAE